MSAVPHHGRPGVVTAALAKVDEFFFEKVAVEPAAPVLATHPCVVVAGLGRRTGATTIARALAVELAGPGGAVVATARLPARAAPAARAARRLAVAFGDRRLRVSGRLCLLEETAAPPLATAAAARYLAPLVVDWEYGRPVADAGALDAPVVLVATPATDPALAAAAAAALPHATVVLNRGREPDEWQGRAGIAVPEARLHARLALAGRPVTGRFGAAIAELAGLAA